MREIKWDHYEVEGFQNLPPVNRWEVDIPVYKEQICPLIIRLTSTVYRVYHIQAAFNSDVIYRGTISGCDPDIACSQAVSDIKRFFSRIIANIEFEEQGHPYERIS